MKRPVIQAIAVLAGVFLLGGLAGSGVTYSLVKRDQAELFGPRHHERRMDAFQRRLNLTDEQRAQIEAIFAKHHERMQQLKEEVFEGCGQPLRNEMDAMDAEIRALLDEEQKQAFDQLRAERQRRGLQRPPGRHGRGWGRGPGPPPPP